MNSRITSLSSNVSCVDSTSDVPVITNPHDHTMETALHQYLQIKIHPAIQSFTGKKIIVRGKYARTHANLSTEKQGKLFNWKRPTAELSENEEILYLNCFPGADYVCHYTSIVESYLRINSITNIQVIAEVPTKSMCIDALLKTNLMQMPAFNIVVLGTIEKLNELTSHRRWNGNGDFCWSSGKLGAYHVALVGCKFSFWGDIAANIIHLLAKKGVESIIYTGKLGGLRADMQPNYTLATGSESFLHGNTIKWPNIITTAINTNIIHGPHYTLPSVMCETKQWFNHTGHKYCFVDPEVGQMANAANTAGINFGYIHLVSDNLANQHDEHLGNERDSKILNKRKISNVQILEILYYNILRLCHCSHMNLRFFPTFKQQLAATMNLKDSTKLDPHNPGAIAHHQAR